MKCFSYWFDSKSKPKHDHRVIPLRQLEKVSVKYDNGTDVDLATIFKREVGQADSRRPSAEELLKDPFFLYNGGSSTLEACAPLPVCSWSSFEGIALFMPKKSEHPSCKVTIDLVNTASK
ncbi:hypothetical protein HAX54_035486 [Datura stramonium]|uniref:Uncharacterized protein n=1 Tax=Datura stramonium TaxID=4076 RepID=A0ABS8VG73_DATST|nr:hypothetical protein [Datura stramonium]